MDAGSEVLALPDRPRSVVIGASLLLLAALVLLFSWVVSPQTVQSNGGQVFFMMLWSVFAYSAFTGLGWVRLAIGAVFIAAIWGIVNSGADLSPSRLAFGNLLAYACEIGAFVALCLPASNQWFAEVAELRKAEE